MLFLFNLKKAIDNNFDTHMFSRFNLTLGIITLEPPGSSVYRNVHELISK